MGRGLGPGGKCRRGLFVLKKIINRAISTSISTIAHISGGARANLRIPGASFYTPRLFTGLVANERLDECDVFTP